MLILATWSQASHSFFPLFNVDHLKITNCSDLTIVFYSLGKFGQALWIRSCHEDVILTRKSHNCAGITFIQGDSAGGSKLIEQTLKSVQSALSDLLTTSATHGTFSRPSTKRGLILIGIELNTNARESFDHCWSYSLNLSIDQHNWTCLSVYIMITRLRNVNLLCFSDSIEGIDFLNCTLKCPVTLKLANQNRYFYQL